MTKPCVVPKCKTGNKSLRVKRSVFKVPNDEERRKKWAALIPGDRDLKPTQFVCERHFHRDCITRKYIKHDDNGRLIAEVPLKRPYLTPDAIPTIFIPEGAESSLAVEKEQTAEAEQNPSEEYHSVFIKVENDSMVGDVAEIENNPLSLHSEHNEDPSTNNIGDETTEAEQNVLDEHNYTERAEVRTPGVAKLAPPYVNDSEVASNRRNVIKSQSETLVETCTITEPPKCKLQVLSTGCVGDGNVSIPLPETWSVSKTVTKLGTEIAFSRIATSEQNNMKSLIINKFFVIENWSSHIQYYVHGKQIRTDNTLLPDTLRDGSSVLVILAAFHRMRICQGAGSAEKSFIKNDAFEDQSNSWHHEQCTLITKKKMCESCKRLKNTLWRRKSRSVQQSKPKRPISNPLDRIKFNALKKKLKAQREMSDRAKRRIELLKTALQQKTITCRCC